MKQKSAVLFLNGPLPPENILSPLLQSRGNALMICADGGYLYARELPVDVDMVIGDLDTLKTSHVNIPSGITVIEEADQNLSDLEKALIYLKKNRVEKVLVLGITGGRTDHVLANISVINRYLDDFQFDLVGAEARLFILYTHQTHITLNTYTGQQISLLAMPKASEVCTKGLVYPLCEETLEWGIREGSSNQAEKNIVEISIKSGCLLIWKNY